MLQQYLLKYFTQVKIFGHVHSMQNPTWLLCVSDFAAHDSPREINDGLVDDAREMALLFGGPAGFEKQVIGLQAGAVQEDAHVKKVTAENANRHRDFSLECFILQIRKACKA